MKLKNPTSQSNPKKKFQNLKPSQQKIQKSKKSKKNYSKKTREISLYSPEYLAKKHGIKINDVLPEKKIIKKEKR